MMLGHVNDYLDLVITISVRGSTGIEKQITFIVDTGYSSTLTLPIQVIHELQLAKGMSTLAMLADGTISEYEKYIAEIFWNDQWLAIDVMGIDGDPLLGTGLLMNHELQAAIINAGQVRISPL